MTCRFVYFLTLYTIATGAIADESTWRQSASGDDGQIRVTVFMYRDKVAPGEVVRISAGCQVLSDDSLRFPHNYGAPLAHLYLQTPDNKLLVYPEGGIPTKSGRPLEAKDYRRPTALKKGQGRKVLACIAPLVNPSPNWRDARTRELVKPNLRIEGAYEAWVKHTIPKVEGAPAGAWHGSVETGRIRFVVREIQVADRRQEPTAEQIAHLEAYMALKKGWLADGDHLKAALNKTENEGLAQHMVELLRTHQPAKAGQPYPEWWWNVNYLVLSRAHHNWPPGTGHTQALKIIGPYLDEFAAVEATALEHCLANDSYASYHKFLALVLDYLKHKPKSPLRQQVDAIGGRYAKVPKGAKPNDNNIRRRTTTSWIILFSLGTLQDGMLFADAKDILGEPLGRRGAQVVWNYTTMSRKYQYGINGEVSVDQGGETIVFTNRDRWTH